jgi:chloramphenicol O-acetyltransferase type A
MSVQKQEIDLATWARAPHFEFFREFLEPCYGITFRVDCTDGYTYAKAKGYSFFQYCLFWTLSAAQTIEAFKLRIEEDRLVRYERLDAGSVIDRPDGTFGFGHFLYDANATKFLTEAKEEVARVRNATELLRPEVNNIIRYSALPWIDFTSITHAQKFAQADSCPRITFGKMTEVNGCRSMPIAVHVHHALVDGRDVGLFVEKLQQFKISDYE